MNEGNNDLIDQKKKFMEQIIIVSKYITIKFKKLSIIESIIQSTDKRIQERNGR